MITMYVVKQKSSNKRYIGRTRSPLYVRWSHHKSKNSRCFALKEAIESNGVKDFEIYPVAFFDNLDAAKVVEEEMIKACKTLTPHGFNIQPGISLRQSTKDKLSNMFKGRSVSDKQRQQLSEIRKANPKGFCIPKPVVATDAKGHRTEYSSVTEAYNNGFNRSCIQKAINGTWKQYRGYKWEFV
jgi:hypothetical protein